MTKILNSESIAMLPSEIFKILGLETRIQILELLKSKGPLGAKSISKELGITTAAVSQHLKILKQARLVKDERKGYWIPYSINEEALEHCGTMLNEVCSCECSVHVKVKHRKADAHNLNSLQQYEKDLQRELEKVREKILKLKSRD